jgi:hypothetical protein
MRALPQQAGGGKYASDRLSSFGTKRTCQSDAKADINHWGS